MVSRDGQGIIPKRNKERKKERKKEIKKEYHLRFRLFRPFSSRINDAAVFMNE
jgi:hypothetical protein